jgi:hypothetical protein
VQGGFAGGVRTKVPAVQVASERHRQLRLNQTVNSLFFTFIFVNKSCNNSFVFL